MPDDLNEVEAIDLSSLGPPVTAPRLDALVAAAVARGEEELERRRGAIAVVRVVVAWRRPVLALAGLAAAAAVVLFARTSQLSVSTEAATAGSIAEALGVPAGYAEAVEGRSFSAAQGGAKKP